MDDNKLEDCDATEEYASSPPKRCFPHVSGVEVQLLDEDAVRTTELSDGLWLITAEPFYSGCHRPIYFHAKFNNYKMDMCCVADAFAPEGRILFKCVGEVKIDENSEVEDDFEGSRPRILSLFCNGIQAKSEQSPEGKWGPVFYEVDLAVEYCYVQVLVEYKGKQLPQQ